MEAGGAGMVVVGWHLKELIKLENLMEPLERGMKVVSWNLNRLI